MSIVDIVINFDITKSLFGTKSGPFLSTPEQHQMARELLDRLYDTTYQLLYPDCRESPDFQSIVLRSIEVSRLLLDNGVTYILSNGGEQTLVIHFQTGDSTPMVLTDISNRVTESDAVYRFLTSPIWIHPKLYDVLYTVLR